MTLFFEGMMKSCSCSSSEASFIGSDVYSAIRFWKEEVFGPCTIGLYLCSLLPGRSLISDGTAVSADSWLTCCPSIATGDAPPEVSVFSLLSFALGFPNGLKMLEASRLTVGGLTTGFETVLFNVASLIAGCFPAATAALTLAWLSITFNCALGGTIAFAKGGLVTFLR